ncbi:MAG: DNA-binding protein [Chloroflexota bacterium]|nr:MAG: DNA-binding protein [Chloroflexota bacterium]
MRIIAQSKARDVDWELLEEERLISLKEAAARYDISHSHLQLLARKSRLKARKMGRDWFTTPEAVEEYLKNPEMRSKDPHKYKRT